MFCGREKRRTLNFILHISKGKCRLMPIYITGAVEQWDEFHRLFFILATETTFSANDLLKGTSFTFHSGKNMISVLTGAKPRPWEQSHMIGRFTSLAKSPKNTLRATWISNFAADFVNWNASSTWISTTFFLMYVFSTFYLCRNSFFFCNCPPHPPPPASKNKMVYQVLQNLSRNSKITLCLHSTGLISSRVRRFQLKNRSNCVTDVLTTYPGI